MSAIVTQEKLKGMFMLLHRRDNNVKRVRKIIYDTGYKRLAHVPESRYYELALTLVREYPLTARVLGGEDWKGVR